MKTLITLLLILPAMALALEVDEKLTVRLLKVSETRKTVMLNRGIEDGLAEGDHAKFIVTAGIVARGVVVKVSPTRSVWSLYRLVNADFIVTDSVMTVKITPPVKITKDESQALVREDVPSRPSGDPEAIGIPLAEGAQDIKPEDQKTTDEDLKAVQELDDEPASIVDRNLELLGMLHISGLSANTKPSQGNSYSNSQSFYHVGLGGEWYPRREREWYSRFSLQAGVALMRENSQAFLGSSVENEITEFEVGANWHPTKLPSTAGAFIPFIHAGLTFGSVKSTFDLPEVGTFDNNGSTAGYSVGFGYKFYTRFGLGFRALVDYYSRAEKYDEDDTNIAWDKTVAGPRLMLGLSYRF